MAKRFVRHTIVTKYIVDLIEQLDIKNTNNFKMYDCCDTNNIMHTKINNNTSTGVL